MPPPFLPRGAWTALATPFTPAGVVDEDRYRRLVEFQIGEGIDGIVPCGTTGESPTLAWNEHDRLIHLAIEVAAGRVGVLAGTGSNNTQEAIRSTRDAKDAGASAVLLVDCYYNGPSSRELREEYYERILAEVPEIPIVPYVIPGRTGCGLSAADLAMLHLSHPGRVLAVKQATGDLDRMRRDRDFAGPELAILSGDDDMTLPMMLDAGIGASGVISVMSNLVPRAIATMVKALDASDPDAANAVADKIRPLLKLVGCSDTTTRTLPGGRVVQVVDKYRNPLPLKTMMAGLGMFEALGRPPLGRMSKGAVERCRAALREVYASAPSVLTPIAEAFSVDVEARLANEGHWNALAAA